MSDQHTPPVATTSATSAPTRQFLAGLEGPRGVAMLCVILVHVTVHFTPSVLAATRLDFLGQALTFFFALSGFLLFIPIVSKFASGGARPDTGLYLANRVRRVFPAYLTIFLIANFVLQAVYVTNPITVSWSRTDVGTGMITDPLKLLASLTLTQSLFPDTLQTGLNPAWSLTTEFGFYLLLPVLGAGLFALRRRGHTRVWWALVPAGVLLVTGLIGNAVVAMVQQANPQYSGLTAYWGPNWVAVLSRSIFPLADTFGYGMVAAVVFVAIGRGAFASVSTARLQLTFGALTVAGTVASLGLFVTSPRYLATVFAFASANLILFIVTPNARGERSAVARVTDWAPLRYLGMISLSGYLWHYPVLILLGRADISLPDNIIGTAISFAIVTSASVLLASITYRYVEKPGMKLGVATRARKKREPATA
ncbi:acyltransferase [Williamsia sp. CHRR-6]|uniref:acyltransferase family protein n=1 Tax=Williamsia sp. CHRR-6 TaxID=2835871 RepID=UPI001BDAF29A|nr:acyltransferase [Williamsia sp. CHRR-6]MBT0565934.1 acyltransferase [Williamsia sp. CHRR-6]